MKKRLFIAAAICVTTLSQAAHAQTFSTQETARLEQNKAVVRGYLNEVINRGNLAALDTYFSEDVVFNGSREAKRQLARSRGLRMAFPDHRLTIEDQVADGDIVVTRVVFQGTHSGEFNGIAPTGKQLKYSGIAMDRIVNGKVVEMWHVASPLGVQEQIAVILGATAAK